MAKKRIYLPNDCWISEPSVHPLNWLQKGASTKISWYIHYCFHDPKFSNHPKYKYGLMVPVRGMNYEKNLEKRRMQTRGIIIDELEDLRAGYNPITGKTISQLNFQPSNFIKSLWDAVEKIKVVPNYREGIKSVIRGVERASKLTFIDDAPIDNLPVEKITRKYIKAVLEKCSQINKKWSARSHNYYRTALIILFKELVRSEIVDINPVRDIDVEKETDKIREVLTKEQRILVNDHLHKNHYEFWRFVVLHYASGARIIELMSLQIKDVNLKNQTFKVTIRKGRRIKEALKPVTNDTLDLWKELISNNPSHYYVFSVGLIPGENKIRTEQVTRRWEVHVKKELRITADLSSDKHLRATSLSEKYGTQLPAKLMSHTNETMLRKVYDVRFTERELEEAKNIKDSFAG